MDRASLDRGIGMVLVGPIARQASDAHAGSGATVSTLLKGTTAGLEETSGRRRAQTALSTYGRAGEDFSGGRLTRAWLVGAPYGFLSTVSHVEHVGDLIDQQRQSAR